MKFEPKRFPLPSILTITTLFFIRISNSSIFSDYVCFPIQKAGEAVIARTNLVKV